MNRKVIRNVISVLALVCMLVSMYPGIGYADEDGIFFCINKKVLNPNIYPGGYEYKFVADATVTLINCDDSTIVYTGKSQGTPVAAPISNCNLAMTGITPGYYNESITVGTSTIYTRNNFNYRGGFCETWVSIDETESPATTYEANTDPNLGSPSGGVIHVIEKNSVQQGYSASFSPGDTVTIDVHPYKGKRLKPYSLKYHNGTTYKNKTQEWNLTPTGYTDGSTASFTMPAFNVTITAEFEAIPTSTDKYTVNFQTQQDDVVNAPAPITNVALGLKIQEPIPQPSKDGFSFEGWYKEFDCVNPWDFSLHTIASNTTLWAKWLSWFKVIFEDYDGGKITESLIKEGSAAAAPAEPNTWEGHHFVRWNKDYSNVKSELWVRAEYEINTYTVTFKDWDGSNLKVQDNIEHGSAATAPANPARPGHRFTGWDLNYSNVTSNMNVTAQYVQTHTVTFDAQGGSTVKNLIVNHGAKAAQPTPAPTKSGFVIDGWYQENTWENAWIFETDKVMSSITLYAKWITERTWQDYNAPRQKSSNEAWTITFNQDISLNSINTDNFYIATDDAGANKVSGIEVTPVDSNPRQVKVGPPAGGWQSGGTYYLFISKAVASTAGGGQNLKSGVRMMFKVNP